VNNYRKWTLADDATLLSLLDTHDVDAIAAKMDRKPATITQRIKWLSDGPTPEEIEQRKAEIQAGWTASAERQRRVVKEREYECTTIGDGLYLV
jgi:hypothetical protein